MRFSIEPVENTVLNLKGWKIVRSDGAILLPFTQRREVEQLIEFFTEGEKDERNSNSRGN